MAKKAKSFEEAVDNAIDELLKDFKPAMKEAVEIAVKQTESDFMRKAKTCLEEYYENFIQERYDRTETLQYAFLPYSKIAYGKDKITGSVGVQYSAEMLEQMMPAPIYSRTGRLKHKGYYGSEQYQPVDAWWVIDNYLKGIHPITNGGTTPEDTIYFEVYDDVSPNQKMELYIKEYGKTFDENVLAGLLGQIAKKL